MTVFTDFGNVVPECDNEGDNSRKSGVLRVTSNLPNLVIPSVSADTNWKIGVSTTVQWTGKNLGPANLPLNSWRDQVWLSRDKVLNSGDIPLGYSDFLQAVPNGNSYAGASTFNVPLIGSGDWFILVQTDSVNQVYEGSNEGDNVSVARIVRLIPPTLISPCPSWMRPIPRSQANR